MFVKIECFVCEHVGEREQIKNMKKRHSVMYSASDLSLWTHTESWTKRFSLSSEFHR